MTGWQLVWLGALFDAFLEGRGADQVVLGIFGENCSALRSSRGVMVKKCPITMVCVGLLVPLAAQVVAAQNPSSDVTAPSTQTTPDSGKIAGPPRDGTYAIGGDVKPPKTTYAPDPPYSDEARSAKYQAWVFLRLVVDPKGLPQQIRVQQSAGMGLDEKAIETAKLWRFAPATKNGQPVPLQIWVEMSFQLHDMPGTSPALFSHPASFAKSPQFPGVDTAKYPLIVTILSAVGSPAAKSYIIGAKATLDGAGPQQSVSLSCSGEKKHCSYLGKGRYPARWLDANQRLEILGLRREDRKWEKTEYHITTDPPPPTVSFPAPPSAGRDN